jgi:Trk K+ transport system NAD-binding subunit
VIASLGVTYGHIGKGTVAITIYAMAIMAVRSIEVLKHAHIGHAKFIISTLPDLLLKCVDNAELVEMCKAVAPHATMIATADDAQHERQLRAKGADAVVRVYEMAADALAEAVTATQRNRRRTDAAVTPAVLVA